MRDNVCESNDPYPIKNTILENYVPWFCDVNSDSVAEVYQYGYSGYVPYICRIDPLNPDDYIDASTGGPNPNYIDIFKEDFYNRLLDGLGDMDSDGMPDGWERQYNLNALVDDAAGDPDEDGLTNINEYNAETNPNDADSDDDGMTDGWEVQYGLNPLVDDADADADGDGWSNLEEYLKETIPNDAGSHPPRPMPWLPLLLEGD